MASAIDLELTDEQIDSAANATARFAIFHHNWKHTDPAIAADSAGVHPKWFATRCICDSYKETRAELLPIGDVVIAGTRGHSPFAQFGLPEPTSDRAVRESTAYIGAVFLFHLTSEPEVRNAIRSANPFLVTAGCDAFREYHGETRLALPQLPAMQLTATRTDGSLPFEAL